MTPASAIQGGVRDVNGPVAGATVRAGSRLNVTRTDEDGRFTIVGDPAGEAVKVSAWANGTFITRVGEIEPGSELDIVVTHLEGRDNADYAFISPFSDSGDPRSCERCHTTPDVPDSTMTFDEWARDPHSTSATNPRFLTMYLGTNMSGQQSPETRFVTLRDYGRRPVPPDPTRDYFGPGYRLDWPSSAGDCATCHAPAGSMAAPYGTDPTELEDPESAGVTCDFCHKVSGVDLDPETGRPYPNRPAMLSFRFHRPPEGRQYFSTPFDDPLGGGSYEPEISESSICAPCHFGVSWETVVYNSFGEWEESDYSDPETGQTCQDCHMSPTGATMFALAEVGGVEHPTSDVASHDMSIESLLDDALDMTVSTQREGNALVVSVQLTNRQTGHHVPTGSPLRQVVLLVEATTPSGTSLDLTDGPLLPDWAGQGDPADGYYAGRPGRAYARILRSTWSNEVPAADYWNPTRVVSDNRIAAYATDVTQYAFDSAGLNEVTVRVRLLYRRAFRDLMDVKEWDTPDILMAEEVRRID